MHFVFNEARTSMTTSMLKESGFLYNKMKELGVTLVTEQGPETPDSKMLDLPSLVSQVMPSQDEKAIKDVDYVSSQDEKNKAGELIKMHMRIMYTTSLLNVYKETKEKFFEALDRLKLLNVKKYFQKNWFAHPDQIRLDWLSRRQPNTVENVLRCEASWVVALNEESELIVRLMDLTNNLSEGVNTNTKEHVNHKRTNAAEAAHNVCGIRNQSYLFSKTKLLRSSSQFFKIG
eukprot:Nk52_evm59s621 gene=Nk52_evmTU59s621